MPSAPDHEPITAVIAATPQAIYDAFTTPAALEIWQAPGEMTGKVHSFDLREGGGYEMSLTYPAADTGAGKTTANEDRFTTRFQTLDPPHRIVQVVTFHTDDPEFAGEMTMTITITPHGVETAVAIAYANVPPGIRPEDNAAGTQDSFRKLAAYLMTTPA